MTFWLGVSIAYLLIAGVGLGLGLELSRRFPGKPDGGRRPEPIAPTQGPTFGVEWSEFDEGFLAASTILADLPSQTSASMLEDA